MIYLYGEIGPLKYDIESKDMLTACKELGVLIDFTKKHNDEQERYGKRC